MVKQHPRVVEGERRTDDRKGATRDHGKLLKAIESDQWAHTQWQHHAARLEDRRFAAGWPGERGVNFPWVDASDVVHPLSDIHINKIAPTMHNTLFGGREQLSFMKPLDGAGYQQAEAAQLLNESYYHPGPTHAMPDYEVQVALLIDSILQNGRGTLKSFWDYEAGIVTEAVRRADMPGILSKLVIARGISDRDRAIAIQTMGQAINPPEILQFFGTQNPIQPLNGKLFGQFRERIRAAIMREYNLDKDEAVDRLAAAEILQYLADGTPDRSVLVHQKAVLHDGPRLMFVHPQHLVVSANAKIDLSAASRITHRQRVSKERFMRLADANQWNRKVVDRALEFEQTHGDNDFLEVSRLNRVGVDFQEQYRDEIELSETMHYKRLRGTRVPVLHRSVFIEGLVEDGLLREAEYDASHGKQPYVNFPFEYATDGYYDSRGVPDILKDPESHVTALYRALENNLIITTAPTFKANRNSFTDPEGAEFTPGEIMMMSDVHDMEQFPMSSNTVPLESLLSSFLPWPEQLLGSTDNRIADSQNFDRPRTATENNILERGRQRGAGRNASLFLLQMGRAMHMTWQLAQQYQTAEVWVAVTGKEPRRVSMAQIRGSYSVLPIAAVGDADPEVRYSKALNRLQVGLAMRGQGLIAGVRYEVDWEQLFIDLMRADDPIVAGRIITENPPDRIQQILESQQAQAEELQAMATRAQKAIANEPMTPEEWKLLINWLSRHGPHKDFQRVIAEGDVAQASVQREATLSGMELNGAR